MLNSTNEIQSNSVFSKGLPWNFLTTLGADYCHREDVKDLNILPSVFRNMSQSTQCSFEILFQNKSPERSCFMFLLLQTPRLHRWSHGPAQEVSSPDRCYRLSSGFISQTLTLKTRQIEGKSKTLAPAELRYRGIPRVPPYFIDNNIPLFLSKGQYLEVSF